MGSLSDTAGREGHTLGTKMVCLRGGARLVFSTRLDELGASSMLDILDLQRVR